MRRVLLAVLLVLGPVAAQLPYQSSGSWNAQAGVGPQMRNPNTGTFGNGYNPNNPMGQQQQPSPYGSSGQSLTGGSNTQYNTNANGNPLYGTANSQNTNLNQNNPLRYSNGQSSYMAMQNGYGQLPKTNSPSLPMSNTPLRLSQTGINGAQVDLKINGYTNNLLHLSNTTTCSCISGNCNYLQPNQQNACKFSFVTIISSADSSVQYFSSDFFPFSGALDGRTPGNWSQAMSFTMSSKPVAIDVFVYHMGVVLSLPAAGSNTQDLLFFDKLTLVDLFVVDVFNYDASDGQTKADQLQGKMLSTSLSLTWSVRCQNRLKGRHCNLLCGNDIQDIGTFTTTTTNSPIANNNQNRALSPGAVLCLDHISGHYSMCNYTSTGQTQVKSCLPCYGAQLVNGVCQTGIYDSLDNADMVSGSFKIWTIVLGCLLGLAVLVILCLIIVYIVFRNRDKHEKGYDSRAYPVAHTPSGAAVGATRPLLNNDDDVWPPTVRRAMPPPPPAHAAHVDRDASRASDDSYRNNGHAATGTQQRQEHQV